MIGPDGEEDRWIENIGDVFVSNYYHYFQVNGRFIPHFFLMTFDALLGKPFFNVFNALLFGLYLHLLNLNFVKERKKALMGLAISASLTLGLMCGFTNEFLWMSGVFNYEFVAVLVLLFNYLLNAEVKSRWWLPLLFLYGVISGWTNEAVVVGLSCVYLFVYIRKWRELKWSQVVLLSGFVLGVAFCVSSPGSIHRALGNSSSEATSILISIGNYFISLCYMYNLRVFFVMLIVWMLVKNIQKVWLVGVLISVLFVTFTGHNSGHSRFGIELFSLIIILYVFPYDKIKGYWGYVVLSLTIVYMLICVPYCVQNYQEFKSVEKQIKNTQNGVILTNEVHPSWYAERMIQRFSFPEESDYCFIYDDWYNPMVARYYGREDVKLYFVPEKFVHDIQNGQQSDTFDISTEYPFYACQWEGKDTPSFVKFRLEESHWSLFPIVGKMKRFAANEVTAKWLLIDIYGTEYLLVKKNSMIEERIIDIHYE